MMYIYIYIIFTFFYVKGIAIDTQRSRWPQLFWSVKAICKICKSEHLPVSVAVFQQLSNWSPKSNGADREGSFVEAARCWGRPSRIAASASPWASSSLGRASLLHYTTLIQATLRFTPSFWYENNYCVPLYRTFWPRHGEATASGEPLPVALPDSVKALKTMLLGLKTDAFQVMTFECPICPTELDLNARGCKSSLKMRLLSDRALVKDGANWFKHRCILSDDVRVSNLSYGAWFKCPRLQVQFEDGTSKW